MLGAEAPLLSGDPVLQPFLSALAGDAERHLATLVADHVTPVIRRVVRHQMLGRGSRYPMHEAEDIEADGVADYVRVRAVASDGEGPASNEVTLTVGASGSCAAPPNAPTGLTAAVTGTTVAFSWAPGGGCPTSNYALHAGSAPGMSNLAVANVGTAQGLTAAAPAGTYYVRVVAQNAFGLSQPSNQHIVTVGGPSGSTGGGGATLTPLAGVVSSFGYRILQVTMPATGQYRATLTWADPTIDLDLYLTTTACSSYPPTNSCMRAESAASQGNMEQISWPVQAGQTYYVWVDSFTHRASTYLIQHTVNGAELNVPEPDLPDATELFKKPKQ